MCIRDRFKPEDSLAPVAVRLAELLGRPVPLVANWTDGVDVAPGQVAVSYTHLRAHETVLDLVCRLLLENKKRHVPHMTQHNRRYILSLQL